MSEVLLANVGQAGLNTLAYPARAEMTARKFYNIAPYSAFSIHAKIKHLKIEYLNISAYEHLNNETFEYWNIRILKHLNIETIEY